MNSRDYLPPLAKLLKPPSLQYHHPLPKLLCCCCYFDPVGFSSLQLFLVKLDLQCVACTLKYAKVLCNNPLPSLRGLKIFYNFSKFFEVWVLVLLLFCFFEFSFYFSVYENRKCIFRLNISFKICQSFPCEQVKACCFRSHKVCNREWPNSVSRRAPHKIFLSFNQGNTLLC